MAKSIKPHSVKSVSKPPVPASRPASVGATHHTGRTPYNLRPTPGLGRGLTDIIAQGVQTAPAGASSASPVSTVRQIPLSQIVPNPRQPRLHFREEPLDELVASIREHGLLQPITVRPHGDQFQIIAGERRFRACQKAALQTIPAIIKVASDAEALELALIENLQREDLDAIEEARGYRQLAEVFSLTQEQIAQKTGRNRATIANAIRLLDLPDEIQGYITQGGLSPGHAKAILGLPDPELQTRLAREAIRRNFSVRQIEGHVNQRRSAAKPSAAGAASPEVLATKAQLQAIQDALQQKLGTRVRLHPAGSGGRIEIQYFTPTDLDRLLEVLQIRL